MRYVKEARIILRGDRSAASRLISFARSKLGGLVERKKMGDIRTTKGVYRTAGGGVITVIADEVLPVIEIYVPYPSEPAEPQPDLDRIYVVASWINNTTSTCDPHATEYLLQMNSDLTGVKVIAGPFEAWSISDAMRECVSVESTKIAGVRDGVPILSHAKGEYTTPPDHNMCGYGGTNIGWKEFYFSYSDLNTQTVNADQAVFAVPHVDDGSLSLCGSGDESYCTVDTHIGSVIGSDHSDTLQPVSDSTADHIPAVGIDFIVIGGLDITRSEDPTEFLSQSITYYADKLPSEFRLSTVWSGDLRPQPIPSCDYLGTVFWSNPHPGSKYVAGPDFVLKMIPTEQTDEFEQFSGFTGIVKQRIDQLYSNSDSGGFEAVSGTVIVGAGVNYNRMLVGVGNNTAAELALYDHDWGLKGNINVGSIVGDCTLSKHRIVYTAGGTKLKSVAIYEGLDASLDIADFVDLIPAPSSGSGSGSLYAMYVYADPIDCLTPPLSK